MGTAPKTANAPHEGPRHLFERVCDGRSGLFRRKWEQFCLKHTPYLGDVFYLEWKIILGTKSTQRNEQQKGAETETVKCSPSPAGHSCSPGSPRRPRGHGGVAPAGASLCSREQAELPVSAPSGARTQGPVRLPASRAEVERSGMPRRKARPSVPVSQRPSAPAPRLTAKRRLAAGASPTGAEGGVAPVCPSRKGGGSAECRAGRRAGRRSSIRLSERFLQV